MTDTDLIGTQVSPDDFDPVRNLYHAVLRILHVTRTGLSHYHLSQSVTFLYGLRRVQKLITY